jgi:simple sugar transport system ATP-binding protein
MKNDLLQQPSNGLASINEHRPSISSPINSVRPAGSQMGDEPAMNDKPAILELRNVNKSFGPIDVLHDISLRVRAGEVLCLLGDNGAGKSTLIKTLAGVHKPTSGQILMDGQPVTFSGPREAQAQGIATVHQFGGTFPLMSIGRSFFVGVEPTKGWGPFKIYDRKRANEIAVKAVRDFGITRIDDGDRLVGGLSGGERQSLAIARAVYFGARLLILDEPTAALGVKQASHVLRIVNEAKRRGLAVVFITHQVMHAMAVGDHFAVLIRGAIAADFRKGDKSREEITDLMAGGETMADLEAQVEGYMETHERHPPSLQVVEGSAAP